MSNDTKERVSNVVERFGLGIRWWHVLPGVIFLWSFILFAEAFPFNLCSFSLGFLLFAGAFIGLWPFKTLGFDCPYPECKKRVSLASPWVCGYCDAENKPVKFWGWASMLIGCGRLTCFKRPRAYACPHCNRMIYFDNSRDGQHPAYALGKPKPEPVLNNAIVVADIEPDEEVLERRRQIEIERRQQQWRSEILQGEIELAKGKKEIEALEAELAAMDEPVSTEHPVEETIHRMELIIQARDRAMQGISQNEQYSAETKKTLQDYVKRIAQAQINQLKPR